MKLVVYICCLVAALLWGKPASAQKPQIKFNLVEGMGEVSLGKINAITQDKDGYMWFADMTKSCITRFDGYRMVSFRHDPLNANSLGGTYPEVIATDSAGNIWIGFYGMGLDMYNPKTDSFTHFRHNRDAPNSLSNDSVTALVVDRDGVLWVGTYGGLDRFDASTGHFIHYTSNPKNARTLSSNRIRSLYEDRQGTIWVGTGSPFEYNNDGGLNRFDKRTCLFTRYLHDPQNPKSIASNKVRAIFEDSKGNFWVGTAGDGLHTMDRLTGLFTRHKYDPSNPAGLSRPPFNKRLMYEHITSITEDVTGALWIGTYESGINRYDSQTGENVHFAASRDEGGFTDRTAWCMYTSKDGVLWISTNEGSLYRVDPLRKNIPHFEVGSAVQGFFEEPSGALWIGTPQGLLLVDRNKKVIRKFVPDSLFQSAKDGFLFAMQDGDDTDLLMTFGSKLLSFNRKTLKFKNESAENIKLSKAYISTILKDSRGQFWIGTSSGLYTFDRKTRILTPVTLGSNVADSNNSPIKNIISLLEDKAGDLWVGTRYGGSLYRLRRGSAKFEHYTVGAMINCMYEDVNATLWVGTTNGLYQFNQASNGFALYTLPGYSLNASDIRNIIEDDNNILWVSSRSGIFKLSKHHAGIITLGRNQGLQAKVLSYAAYKLQSGELLFGDAAGYYAFFPDQLTKNLQPPQIVLTDFRISNHLITPRGGCPLNAPLQQMREIELAHNQNTFSFNFAGIHYSNPSENSHVFMLENHEDNWRNAGTEHSAHYFNLPPGKYIFKLKAISSDGMYAIRTLPITIVPAWWNTWWFRITAGLCIALTLFGMIRWWLNQKFRLQLERSEKEKQLANLKRKTTELEMQALRAQMNPHFIFNSLNSINRFILQNNKVQASEYLTKFSKLIRLILQNSQASLIPLESELESLQLYLELEALRFDNHFAFKITVDPDLDISSIKVPPLIIQPYAENAIWHGLMHKEETGNLEIELFEQDNVLCCKIVDDGIGRKKASELKSKSASTHKSMGMRITSDRIAMLQQKRQTDTYILINDLVLPDGNAGGTEVILKIPLTEN